MLDFSQLLNAPDWQGLQDWQSPDPGTEPPPLEMDPEFQRIMAMKRAVPQPLSGADRLAMAASQFRLPDVRVNYRTLGTGGRVGIGLLAALQGLANAYGASKMPGIAAKQQAAEQAAQQSDEVRKMLTQDLIEKRRAARANAAKVRYRLPQSGQTVYIDPNTAARIQSDRQLLKFTYPDGTTAMLTPSEYNAALTATRPAASTEDAVANRKQQRLIASYNARLDAVKNRMARWKSVIDGPNTDPGQLPKAQAEYDRLSGEYDRLAQEMSDRLEGNAPAPPSKPLPSTPTPLLPSGKTVEFRAQDIVEQARRADTLRDPTQRAQAQEQVRANLARWEQETPGVAARVKELNAGGR